MCVCECVGGEHSCRPIVDPVSGNRISAVRTRRRGQKVVTLGVKEPTSQRGTSSKAKAPLGEVV